MDASIEKLRGKFIVIDGPDGSGKSTHIGMLCDDLRRRGLDICPVRDPGGTVIGDKIRQILLDRRHDEMAVSCELMLYMASRAQLVEQIVRPAMKQGRCVIGDRYISSTLAYQVAGGIDPKPIRQVAQVAVGGLWPDLTVILDLPAEVGLQRIRRKNSGAAQAFDRMEAKPLEYHQRVRQAFLQQAKEDPAGFAVVDADAEMAQVQERLAAAVQGRFGQ